MSDNHELADELRRLRTEREMSGRTAAQQAGMSQSRFSRIERGAFMPTIEEVRTLCRLYFAPAATTRRLVSLARDFQAERATARVVLQRGAWRMQERIHRIEQASRMIRSFQPSIVIGLLQTAEYMQEVFGAVNAEGHTERMTEIRTERKDILESDRNFSFLMSEGALRWNLGGPRVMVPQLEHLAELAGAPNIRLGIIPWTTPSPVPPFHAFHLYDSQAAVVGTLTATAVVRDERDIADYESAFAALEKAADFDEEAQAIIHRIAANYRSLT